MFLNWSLCFIFFSSMHQGSFLSMDRLEVPGLAKLFQPLQIACRYRLGYLRLESVKWYKDDEEFFRFTPSEQPQTRMFNNSRVEIDMKKSDMHVLSFTNITVSSAGVYRCEVSSDSPAFETVQESKRMDVFYLPYKKPRIDIRSTEIRPNEDIVAECVTGKSFPVQKIFWFLNGIQVNKNCVKKEYITVEDDGLLTEHSRLQVRARGGPGPIMVSCVGSQGMNFSSQRSYVELTLRGYIEDDTVALSGRANFITKNFKGYIIFSAVYAIIAITD